VGLRNAHHLGRFGHWAEQCAHHGMVSFHFVNVAGDPLVAPYGGIDARFGTNPFCAAFPRYGKAPIALDFATSAIAHGKTRVAHNEGIEVPPGALIDYDGHPTRDPGVMHRGPRGSLLAFGADVAGHKGSGLAAMCEIFGGALTGGLTSRPETLVRNSVIVNGMLSVIIDPLAFDAPDAQQEAEAFLGWLKTARPGRGFDEAKLPGEPEQAMREQRSSSGIPLDAVSWEQITAAARQLGVAAEQIPRVEPAG